MNDDFEKKLQRQMPRQIPAEWRAEILSAATKKNSHPAAQTGWPLLNWLAIPWRDLIWPSRRVWAGMAAAWVVIVVVNLRDVREIQMARHDFTPPSPAVMMAWRDQERSLTDFSEQSEARDVDRPRRLTPTPRSERQIFQG